MIDDQTDSNEGEEYKVKLVLSQVNGIVFNCFCR